MGHNLSQEAICALIRGEVEEAKKDGRGVSIVVVGWKNKYHNEATKELARYGVRFLGDSHTEERKAELVILVAGAKHKITMRARQGNHSVPNQVARHSDLRRALAACRGDILSVRTERCKREVKGVHFHELPSPVSLRDRRKQLLT